MVKRRLHKTKRSGKKRSTRKMRGGAKPGPPNPLLNEMNKIRGQIANARNVSLSRYPSSKPSTPPKPQSPVSFSAQPTSRVPPKSLVPATATSRINLSRKSLYGIRNNKATPCTLSTTCKVIGDDYECYKEITPGSNMYKNSGGTPGICLSTDDTRIQQYNP